MLPHMQTRLTGSARQDGAALLILLVIVIIAATGVLLDSLNRASVTLERDRITAETLAQAKEALIGNAVGVSLGGSARPGDLPCPDRTNDGSSDTPCDVQADRIGRLPWKTLGLPDLRDGYGERLWYAVSNNFKNSTRTTCTLPGQSGCLNSDTRGTITVRGSAGNIVNNGTDSTGAIAIIIAPGAALIRIGLTTLQDRGSAGQSDATNYLDLFSVGGEDNANFFDNNLNGFINGEVRHPTEPGRIIVNDKLITITYQDLMPKLEKRVAKEAFNCLRDYAADPLNQGRLPWAAPLNPLATPSYSGASNTPPFGRLPNTFDATVANSGVNPMKNGWTSSCNLNLGTWPFNWSEMVFYAVADAYKPQPTLPPSCGVTGTCLTINPPPATADKQFVVFVAGRQFSNQLRSSNADKGAITNYLEDQNASIDDTYMQGSPTSTFNDTLIYQ